MTQKLLKNCYKIVIGAICCCLFNQAIAQTPPFYNDIQAFKKSDSVHAPVKNAILLVGSSSFTKWTDVQNYFPGHTIVNRAFGGSTLPDLIRYVDEMFLPYQPGQVIIYCGENDFASSDSITARIVLGRFKKLFQLIRNQIPGVPIAFVSIKPSPSRERLWPKMEEGNALIKKFLKKQKHTKYIDVYHKMFNTDGTVMRDVFTEDDLHMNAKGYAIWQKAMEPNLLSPSAVQK